MANQFERCNDASHGVIGAAIDVHRELGPGLIESLYVDALCIELRNRRISFARELELPVRYKGELLGRALRLDLLVENALVVEAKAVESLLPVHTAQLLSYLKLSEKPLGLLLNFNVRAMREGVRRVILNT